jgi:hypothetical protein
MKKTVFFLSIVLIIFELGCKSKENPNQTKDSIVNQNESTLIEIDSVAVDANTIPVFNIDERKYNLCYVKNGELYFYDIKDNISVRFPDSSRIEHVVFGKDRNTLFYTAHKNGKIWMKKAVITGNNFDIQWLADLKIDSTKLKTETYDEKGKFLFRNDSLFLEYEYVWMEGFSKMIVFNLKNNKFSSKENNVYIINEEINTKKGTNNIKLSERFNSRPYKDTYELFLTKLDKSEIKISETKHLDSKILSQNDEENAELTEYSKEFMNIIPSPDSSKLMFSIITGMGDLAHGPTFIVNIDGKNQKKICDDGISGEINPVWINKSNVAFNKDFDNDGKKKGLYISDKANNYTFINDNVNYFIKR